MKIYDVSFVSRSSKTGDNIMSACVVTPAVIQIYTFWDIVTIVFDVQLTLDLFTMEDKLLVEN